MYLGLSYILNNSIFPWLDPIMIVIVFIFLAGALGIFILLQIVTQKKELWPSEELEKNKKLVVTQLKEKREEANKKITQMGIQMCISEIFLQLRPRILETMMDKTLSREEQLNKMNEMFDELNAEVVLHQAKKKEINQMYLEEVDKQKTIDNEMRNIHNKYDYTFPNLSKYLRNINYKKYNKEIRTSSSFPILNENPTLELSNEISFLVDMMNPKIRAIPEHFIRSSTMNFDNERMRNKRTFSRRKKTKIE